MEQIRKPLRLVCQNLCLYFLVVLFLDNIANVMAYVMLEDVDPWDWTYYYVQSGELAFTIVLTLFSLLLYCLVRWARGKLDPHRPFLPQLRAYLIILFLLEQPFVTYVALFRVGGDCTPFTIYQAVFESAFLGRLLLLVMLYGLFAGELVMTHLPVLLKDRFRSCAAAEALCDVDILEKSIYFGYPLFYLLLFENTLWEFPIPALYVLCWGFLIGRQLFMACKIYRTLVRYFTSVSESDADSIQVLVREAPGYEMSVTYSAFLEDKLVSQKLEEAGIRVIPVQLYEGIPQEHIVLDIYRLSMFKLKPEQQQELWDQTFPPDAVVSAAYCADSQLLQQVRHYDKKISSFHSIPDEILSLAQYYRYRIGILGIMEQLHLQQLPQTGLIAGELHAFRKHILQNLDSFTAFDHAIKWLEIISYFFSLVSITNREIPVDPDILLKLKNADFGKWQTLRKDDFRDPLVSSVTSATVPQGEREAFEAFCWLWKKVTTQIYTFQTYDLDTLFNKLRELRNYTRGHGVFSFEITPEFNLKLAVILVFLINRLIDSTLLEQSFQKLEKLGWVVFAGETPYFLYCYDSRNRECRFDSFRTGSSLTLPEDYR